MFAAKLWEWFVLSEHRLNENPKNGEDNPTPSLLFLSHSAAKAVVPFLSAAAAAPPECVEFSSQRNDIKFSSFLLPILFLRDF